MYQEVIPESTLNLIDNISPHISGFYLAGGTGLALQLGHRISEDLDFFNDKNFSPEEINAGIAPDKVVSIRPHTLHCIKDSVRLSFLFYEVPLCYPMRQWRGLNVAAWQDIVAEKIKTLSQRGSKKDFWDVYSVISSCSTTQEVSALFLERFKDSGINLYHVLKTLVYFEDAENDPDPLIIDKGEVPSWNRIKGFFIDNIKEFEEVLLS